MFVGSSLCTWPMLLCVLLCLCVCVCVCVDDLTNSCRPCFLTDLFSHYCHAVTWKHTACLQLSRQTSPEFTHTIHTIHTLYTHKHLYTHYTHYSHTNTFTHTIHTFHTQKSLPTLYTQYTHKHLYTHYTHNTHTNSFTHTIQTIHTQTPLHTAKVKQSEFLIRLSTQLGVSSVGFFNDRFYKQQRSTSLNTCSSSLGWT